MKRILTTLLMMLFVWNLCALGEGKQGKKSFKELTRQERHELFKAHREALARALADDERHEELKETIITGNQIRVLVTNQGSISTPDADNANADLVWPAGPNGLGYAYEFGPLIGAEVIDENGDTLHIISDGFINPADGDYEPGTTNRWGWEPKRGFADPNSNEVATFSDLDTDQDGKPDSWPENWYNQTLGRYVWPAFLGDDATTPDEEVFYVMDDLDNAEFPTYHPFPSDSTLKGLGMDLQVRIFQFNNPLAEDLIFLVYTVTNISQQPIDKVFLGMFGDPHIGGPNDFADDNASFISAFDETFPFNTRNMLYAWDNDGIGDQGKIPGYFGYRFLESPGIDDDGADNDNDGLTDESQFNDAGVFQFNADFGIYREPGFHWSGDEDGDWLEEFDDVGVDGIPNTGDLGEGDGKPNQLFYLDLNSNSILDPGEPTAESRLEGMRFYGSEPNFGFLDIAESDQLGLTSFNALLFGGNNRPKNDQLMWDLISSPNQRPGDPPPEIEQESDNVFIYGSGSFRLEPGESQRFSIALLMGEDFGDLLSNAEISQQVFESDYRFAQAPDKPKLTAVPGDGKVTLYWDNGAEQSFDPFVARANPNEPEKGFDFEGYRIYRSRDYSFNDTKTITDSKGVPFLSEPLLQVNGVPAQFDLDNEFIGLSEIEYAGRGVRYDLGNNTGLVHSFIDSNNVVNGVTYFYAVTSYDHGDVNGQLSPTESQRTIQRDAVTRLFSFDINTAMVVPGPPAAGYIGPDLDNGNGNLAAQESGNATGSVSIEFLDPLQVKDGKKYDVTFVDVDPDSEVVEIAYTVVDLEEKESRFSARDTLFVDFGSRFPVVESSITVFNSSGAELDPSQFQIDPVGGRIRGSAQGDMPVGETFTIRYLEAPVYESQSLNGEDDNPVFDGMRLFATDNKVALDSLSTAGGKSGFSSIETATNFSDEYSTISLAKVGNPRAWPTDFELRFVDYDTTADGKLIHPADSSAASLGNVKTPFKIFDTSTGDRVAFFINESNPSLRNKRWDWQETIVLIRPGATQVTQTTYQVKFTPPFDTTGGVTVYDDPVYPGEGDVFRFFSLKPFDLEDQYTFTTKSAAFSNEIAKDVMDEIIVVPNPYISYSAAEIAGVRTGDRDDRRIEFRNLPPKCTIRIYTIVGELVAKLEKDDPGSTAVWNLLTFESQSLAYGVYIYHVDAPGVGTKIGRLGIIK